MTDGEASTLLIQSSDNGTSNDQPHVQRVVIPEQEIPVSRILDMLGDRGVQSLLVEGGADTWGRFLSEGMVDRARLCVSPVDLGGFGPSFTSTSLSENGLQVSSRSDSSGDEIEWWGRSEKKHTENV